MSKRELRVLQVAGGGVQCTPEKREPVVRCRFCVHSVEFYAAGHWIGSPARAFCTLQRATDKVDLKQVEAVRCDDTRGEGFRSMMNVIT